MSDYDPDDLWQETTAEEIHEWIELCDGMSLNDVFTDFEEDFLESVRKQFEDRENSPHPLSGKQLVVLRQMVDKVEAN